MASNRNNGHSDDETQYIGPIQRGERPKQYFPGEHDPNQPPEQQYQYRQPQYQEPGYQPGPVSNAPRDMEPRSIGGGEGGGGSLTGLFAAIAVIALLAAGALFFLWRNASADADKPAPQPVTQTATVTQTTEVPTTVTVTETESGGQRSPGGVLPSRLPDNLRPTGTESLDIEGWLQDMLGDSGSREPRQ